MKKCALILILILAGLAVLTACTDPVEVASIAVSDKAEDFKTDYIIGEELDLTGILLTVTRTDGESYDVYADDIKQDLRILNFSTERPVEKLTVILEYKGVRTSYEITVRTSEEGALRYTVTFNSMGGSAVEAQSVPAYSMAVAPADPVLSGYAFKGWYRESTYNNVFNFSTTNITADITLYARWAELHTVAFYGLRDGVDPETADPAVNPDDYVLLQYADVPEGDAFTAIPAVPAKEGFSATWDRTVFSSVAGDLDVYPIYTPIYHTVTFVVETADGERTVGSISDIREGTYLQYADGTLNPEYAEIIEGFVAQVESMEIPGREFQGNWYPELTNQILSNVTFVANFGARYYNVRLLMNDGTDDVFATIPVQYNLTLNQNSIPGTPERDGYAFNGWYSDPECNQAWNFTTAITGERTLYAGWRELLPVYFYIPTSSGLEFVTQPEYDAAIGYEADGVKYNLYQTVYVPIGDGVSATAAVVPQAVGHSGIWRYRENGQSFNGVTSLEESAELYVDYSRLNYTVRFIANNETVMTAEVPYQSTVVPPQDPTMPGYSFVHWTTGGAAVEDFSALKITSNIDFTAEFSANSYQVEFYYYANSATADHRISVQYGYSFTFPPVVQQGSRLTGWYAQNNYSTASQWGAGVPLTEANIESRTGTDVDFGALGVNSTVLTLYGGWVRQYTVTFQDEEGGSIGSAVTLDENTVVTADMAPTVEAREGYAQTWNLFENGVLGGEYEFGTPITSNLVLRAQYSPLEYEVSFEIEFRYKDNTAKGSYIFSERTIHVLHGNTIGAGANIPGADNLSDNEKAAIAAGTGYEELPADFEIMWINTDETTIANTVINAADVRFRAYCYVRVFTVTWYSTEVGELTEDAVLQTASVEFGKSVPPYTGETPSKPGYNFDNFVVYTPEGETAGSTTNVTKDLALRPSFTAIEYLISIAGPNGSYAQYDQLNQEKPLNADGDAAYRYGEMIRLTEGVNNVPPSVHYSDIEEIGYDITGWSVSDGSYFMYDSAAGKWYLPTAETPERETDVLIVAGGVYYTIPSDGGIYGVISGWTPSAVGNEEFNPDPNGGNKQYFSAVFLYVTENVDLTLQRAVTQYTVTLHYTEERTETAAVAHGTFFSEPADPTMTDKVFIGWYTDESYSVRYDFGLPVTSSFDLWARWDNYIAGSSAVKYEISIDGLSAVAVGYDPALLDEAEGGVLRIANYYVVEDGGEGLPVGSIGAEAFKGLPNSISEVIIPDSVTVFGDAAFSNSGLTRIVLPEQLTAIPANCFRNAKKLETVVFRSGGALRSIGDYAFYGADALKLDVLYLTTDYEGKNVSEDPTRSLPEGLTTIGQSAFQNATAVTVVRFPSTITTISRNAFVGTELKFVVTSSDYITLGVDVFKGAADAFRVFVPNVLTYSGMGWQSLSGRIFDKDDISGDWAYTTQSGSNLITVVQYLGNDSEVTVSDTLDGKSVAAIGDNAFGRGVTKVTFCSGTLITDRTFAAAKDLREIAIVRTGDFYAENGAALVSAFQSGLTGLDTLGFIDPDRPVSSILDGLTLPNTVRIVKIENTETNSAEIPESFLSGATAVAEVVISGAHITGIGDNAFRGMTALEKVRFNGVTGLTAIGVSAFDGDRALSAMITNDVAGLPESLTEIGDGAFNGVPWINEFASNGFTVVGKGILYDYTGSDEIVRVPGEITSVSPGAFSGLPYIQTVILTADGEVNIAESAFSGMPQLEAVYIIGSANIAEGAFLDSSKFVALVVKGSLQIADGALRGTLYENESVGDTGLNIYTEGGTETTSEVYGGYNVTGDIDLGEDGWLYSSDTNQNRTAIKYIADGNEYVDSERITLSGEYSYVAGYAFPRGATDIEVYTSVIPKNAASPFGGVTTTSVLTLMVNAGGVNDGANSIRGGAGNDNLLYSLVRSSKAASVRIRINAAPSQELALSLPAVFNTAGNGISSKITSVEIIVTDNSKVIPDEFMYGLRGIDTITVTNGVDSTPLETAETLLERVSIGARAFRDTGWMERQSDLVMIGGTLIDAKSQSPVIELGENVTEIAGYAFADRPIETLVINGAGTVNLDNAALDGAENIRRVYVADGRTVTVSGNNGELTIGTGSSLTLFDDASWGGQAVGTFVNIGSVRLVTAVQGNGRNVQYIIGNNDNDNGTLYMYREYAEENGAYLSDFTDISIPASVTFPASENSSYEQKVSVLGIDVLYTGVRKLGIAYSVSGANAAAFSNLADLDELEIVSAVDDESSARISGQNIRSIISAHNINRIVYDGSVTFEQLMGANETDSGISGRISEVEIAAGTVKTVENLLVGWNSISSVIFPNTIRKVGTNSLENTDWYNNLLSDNVILGGVLYYKYKASTSVTSVTIPKDVLVINTEAFADMGLIITTVNFEAGSAAEEILEGAFRGCSALNSLSIPSTLTKIAASAFDGTAIKAENDMLTVDSNEGGKVLIRYYGSATEVVLTGDIRVIADGAFKGNTTIQSITFTGDPQLLSIGAGAFEGCTALSYMPGLVSSPTIRYVGENAFEGTAWLNDQSGDVYIGSVGRSRVLYRYGGGEQFEISGDLYSITAGEIDRMAAIVNTLNFNGESFIMERSVMESLLSMSGVYRVIASGTQKLSDMLGGVYENITSVSFDTEGKIAAEALAGWSNVETVTIYSAAAIGKDAFAGTAWFNGLTPDENDGIVCDGRYILDVVDVGVTEISYASDMGYACIADGAFDGAAWLTSIDLSTQKSLNGLPENLFAECENLVYVKLPGSIAVLPKLFNDGANVTVELTNDTVIEIAQGAFTGVSNVKVPSQLLSEYCAAYPEFEEKFII